jgi:hypothetical protein
MGGISLPAWSAAAISGSGRILVYAASKAEQSALAAREKHTAGLISNLATPFRPPQWSVGIPAMTMLTIPAEYSGAYTYSDPESKSRTGQAAGTAADGTPLFKTTTAIHATGNPLYLVFDGVMHISHSQRMIPTEHPVQDGANLSNHIRATQAIISMEVLMTDVLPAYAKGQWTGNQSKSVACFQTLDALRLNRVPLILTTRLKTYSPIFILDVVPDETVKTRYGFRGRIELKQLNLFSVATQTISARDQTTNSTTLGQTNPTAVPAGVNSQNKLLSPSQVQKLLGDVIGAGNYSSNNATTINSVTP